MSSKVPNRIKQALGLRLTWYFGLFTLAGFVLFGATYASLSSYLRHQDRRTLATELAELADGYRRGGLQAIRDKIAAQDRAGAAPFFVRIVAPDRTSVFVHVPPQWDEAFDLDRLSRVDAAESWVEIPSKDPEEQETLEITGTRLSDGASLQVGLNSEGRLDLLEQIRNALAVAMIGVIAISLAAGALLAVRALRPLRDLLAVLRSITATGALDARAPVAGTGDELDELSRLFNTLLGRIELLIAGMRDTLDTVAHDLRTPMTRLRGTAEMALRSNAPPDQLREALATCIEESDQILAMLNTLYGHLRSRDRRDETGSRTGEHPRGGRAHRGAVRRRRGRKKHRRRRGRSAGPCDRIRPQPDAAGAGEFDRQRGQIHAA